jgi:two-component system KDP operon response regulator KdpE
MIEPKNIILIVDDEAPIRRFLKASLSGLGYRVVEAVSGAECLSLAASHHPDVILLDLGLPDQDGLTVLRKLRAWCETPVIILSARGNESDKVAGLENGADDYLTKPFGMGELTARLKVALRHAQSKNQPEEPIIRSGDLTIDHVKHLVLKRGVEIHLTPNEWGILEILSRHPGKLVTQTQLLKEIWGDAWKDNTQYLRTYLHQLRHKLEDEPARPKWLITEPGVGYRFKSE